ncbi:Hypothetical_protein [Hexamita inflata]|uniref:Hypothetical_protein n=1 Tax=Hexamita inflata TaxID=28002 RepID=A0AA86U4L0_9EUKA|nr:Hypothetical protein HINF_LOCUS25337 [Hexamita inflata]CAI9944572.1 Hypothetical protein HINF_LOCUS32217 [Hexamita inflata]
MISQVCEFTNIIYIAMSGISLKINLKITIVSSTIIKYLFSLLNFNLTSIIPELPVQERLPSSHAILYGELSKSLFLASFLLQIIIIWQSLPTKLSESSRASEFIQVLILVRFPESQFRDQIRQRSEKINFSQKFTDIIKNTNIQQQVSKCPKNELQDMLNYNEFAFKKSNIILSKNKSFKIFQSNIKIFKIQQDKEKSDLNVQLMQKHTFYKKDLKCLLKPQQKTNQTTTRIRNIINIMYICLHFIPQNKVKQLLDIKKDVKSNIVNTLKLLHK